MVSLKTEEEIEIMRQGGKKLRQVLNMVVEAAKPGVTKTSLDELAESEIKKLGGKPSFKMVHGYKWASCLTVNDEVVHGIPKKIKLKAGDILGIDVGMYYKGFHTDMATTIEVPASPPGGQGGPASPSQGGGSEKGKEKRKRFLEVGRQALEAGLKQAKEGNYVGDISLAIQNSIKEGGYSPVRVLTGHGVGRVLHEDPIIPCFLEEIREKTPKLEEGMTLAIEVIYNEGNSDVVLSDDGWTIVTADGKISGLFEKTVAITGSGCVVLTN